MARFSRENKWTYKNVRVEFLSFFSEKFLILRRIRRDSVINVHESSCKVLVIRIKFSWNFNFLDTFFEIYSNIKLNGKSVQWEPGCSMRTDRRTHMTKLTVVFRSCVNAPKHRLCNNKISFKICNTGSPEKTFSNFYLNSGVRWGSTISKIPEYVTSLFQNVWKVKTAQLISMAETNS